MMLSVLCPALLIQRALFVVRFAYLQVSGFDVFFCACWGFHMGFCFGRV